MQITRDRTLRRRVLVALSLVLSFGALTPMRSDAESGVAARGRSAVDTVLEAFDHYPLVAVGERHFSVAVHLFLRELIEDPRFASKVNDIVVECGNQRFQEVADRYVRGEDVPIEELRSVWRETTQILVWDSPLYEQLYSTVRTLNAKLPADRRIRVLLGDPPIDWRQVEKPPDYQPFAAREPDAAAVVEREVLAKHRRALIIFGTAHLSKGDPYARYRTRPSLPTITQLLELKKPGSVFVFYPLIGKDYERLGAWRPGEALLVRGTAVGRRSLQELGMGSVTLINNVDGKQVPVEVKPEQLPAIETMADGLLWVARSDQEWRPCRDAFDRVYLTELKRRATILDAFFGLQMFVDEVRELSPLQN
jgi:hypothetical protein